MGGSTPVPWRPITCSLHRLQLDPQLLLKDFSLQASKVPKNQAPDSSRAALSQ